MNRSMSSLLVAMLMAASVPVSAQMRERGASASQRPQQQQRVQQGTRQVYAARSETRQTQGAQPQQQQNVQQVARPGNAARGETRQFQNPSSEVRGEQHASRPDGRFAPWQHPQANRDSDRNSRDFRNGRQDDGRRFGSNEGRPGFDRQPRYAGYQGWNGNHNGWSNGNHYGWGRANDPRVDRMQAQERNRIEQGIRSGQLTRSEADRLIHEQRSIQAEERRYRADGVLTRAERTDLYGDLNAASRHIYNETHDDQVRR